MSIGSDMGGAGFEPAKALPPDLQSGPFGRLGIHPWSRSLPVAPGVPLISAGVREELARPPGVAPHRGRAGGETRTHNPRFTKPKLCRLSYASASIVRFHRLPVRRSGEIHSGREIVHYTNTMRYCKAFPTLAEKNIDQARGRGARAARRGGNKVIIRSAPCLRQGGRMQNRSPRPGRGLIGPSRGPRPRLRWSRGHGPRAGY
jgi:hypothetical protein